MNFTFLTTLDTTKAVRELAINSPLWDAFTLRQTLDGSPHVGTKCIPLRGDLSFPFALGAPRPRTCYAASLPECLALANTVLAGLPVTEVGLAMLVLLKPGGVVLPHPDEGEYAEHFSRLHIVIDSAPGNWLSCGTETAYPTDGQVFIFNHHIVHSAGNPSNKGRIHLIVDVKLKEPQWQSHQLSQ